MLRRYSIFLIIAGLILTFTGCKSDRSSTITPTAPSEAPAPAAAETPDNRPLIVCFGDSLTAGYGTDPGHSYPDYLQTDLDSLGYKYRVLNEGISGNTTKDALQRLGDILALKPAIAVVEFGGNDGLRGLHIDASRSNLSRIVATLKNNGVQVVLAGITLPPDYGPDYIRQFNETYTLIAKQSHIPMLPFLLQGVYGVDGMMQADRTHATAEGNRIVAKNVLALVKPLLKK